MIYSRDTLSSIFLHQNTFLYVANKSKQCIQLYYSSGLPLNIFTKQFGNDYLHNTNFIQNPNKIYIDNNSLLYICNNDCNITRFNLQHNCTLEGFGTKDYLDRSLLHLNPIDISIKEDQRICILYQSSQNSFKIGIYTYDGEKINIIDLDQIGIPHIYFHHENSYLYLLDNYIFSKYDKNGIPTNFTDDEYGNSKQMIQFNQKKILSTQFLHNNKFLIFSSPLSTQTKYITTHLYDFKNTFSEIYSIRIDVELHQPELSSFYFDTSNSYLYILSTGNIHTFQLPDFLTKESNQQIREEDKNVYSIQLPISYDPQSNYIPTTNIEVIQFLCSKQSIYKKLLTGYTLSNQYLNENKEYALFYYDFHTKETHKIHSYELIFILQSKFLLNIHQYQNDPFIQKYPQHFSMERKNFAFYQSRKQLYLAILQTYKEALLYQNLCNDLQKVLFYDDYLNLTDNIQLFFSIQDPFLFPRLHKSQLKANYNKKQCIIINQSLIK
jgi:hypothetical protein